MSAVNATGSMGIRSLLLFCIASHFNKSCRLPLDMSGSGMDKRRCQRLVSSEKHGKLTLTTRSTLSGRRSRASTLRGILGTAVGFKIKYDLLLISTSYPQAMGAVETTSEQRISLRPQWQNAMTAEAVWNNLMEDKEKITKQGLLTAKPSA